MPGGNGCGCLGEGLATLTVSSILARARCPKSTSRVTQVLASASCPPRRTTMVTKRPDWSTPAAMAIPPEGYFELERGRYGPTYPKTPACHGFSIIAKVKDGREEVVRAYGKTIEETIAASPDALAPLRLHYLRWVLFDVGS